MNYSPVGWYYNDVTDRAPAWTGVEFFYNFITENNSNGPFGVIVNPFEAQVGDVITLSKSSGDQFHTLFISNIINGSFFVSSHTRDGLDIPLEVFSFYQARFIHIQGVRDI